MKSKLKKSLSLLLALVMAMSCMSLSTFATVTTEADTGAVASAEVKGVKTYYTSLMEAINAAYNGGTVELLKDIDLAYWHQNLWTMADGWHESWNVSIAERQPYVGPKDLTINGNNHVLKIGKISGGGGNGVSILANAENLSVSNLNVEITQSGDGFSMVSGNLTGVTIKTANGRALMPSENCAYESAISANADTISGIAGITVEDCVLESIGNHPLYVSEFGAVDEKTGNIAGAAFNLIIRNSTLKMDPAGGRIILRSNEKIENCEIVSVNNGQVTVDEALCAAAHATLTGNNFNSTKLKVNSGGAEKTTITGNIFSGTSAIKRGGNGEVDLSDNYWGGSEPSFDAAQYATCSSWYTATEETNSTTGARLQVTTNSLQSNGATENAPWEGSGTSANDPYLIANAADLAALATYVNEGKETANKYWKLTDNIALTGIWTPIGYSLRKPAADTKDYSVKLDANPYFAGTFDGDGYTISGLSNYSDSGVYTPNNDASVNTRGEYVYGLFGVVGAGATLKDVKLTGVDIDTTKTDDSGKHGDSVGALAGYSFGDLTVSDVTVNGSIKGSEGVGAIVGRIYQGRFTTDQAVSLTNCSATATVSGDGTAKSKVSGLFGYIADHGMNQLRLTMTGNTFTGTESGGTFNSQIACLNTSLFSHTGYVTISGNKHGTLDTQSAIAQDGTDKIVVFEDVAATFAGMTDEQILANTAVAAAEANTVVEFTPTESEANTSYAAEKVSESVVTKYEVKVAATTNTANTTKTEASVSSVDTAKVIAKATTSASNAISVGGTNTIELFVKADNQSTANDTITYEVDPYAIVNGDTSNPVKLSNSDLNEGASFTFSVPVNGIANGKSVRVIHRWDTDAEHNYKAGSVDMGLKVVADGKITLDLGSFSYLDITEEYVPEVFGEIYDFDAVFGNKNEFNITFLYDESIWDNLDGYAVKLYLDDNGTERELTETSGNDYLNSDITTYKTEGVKTGSSGAKYQVFTVKMFAKYFASDIIVKLVKDNEAMNITSYNNSNFGISAGVGTQFGYSMVDFIDLKIAGFNAVSDSANAAKYTTLKSAITAYGSALSALD